MYYQFSVQHTDGPEQICYSRKDQPLTTTMNYPAGANKLSIHSAEL